MKIYYFSFTRFPSEKAHSLYMAKVCESFADLMPGGVTLVVPRRLGCVKEKWNTFYGVKNNFKVIKLPCIDLFYLSNFLRTYTFYLAFFSFLFFSFLFTILKVTKQSFVITNDALVALALTCVHKKVVYEMHDFPQRSLWLYRSVFKRVWRIQTNNYQKQKFITKQFDVPKEKMYTAHNGVTITDFDMNLSQEEARKELGLDPHDKIVVYTGRLYDWKGADILAETAAGLPGIQFLFVGGSPSDVISMQTEYLESKNIMFMGYKPHQEIPLYQKAADVLVVPNTAKMDISRLHTSPMKIFEYMASQTPIVAANIPSVREILNERNSILFIPDKVQSLELSILKALNLSVGEKSGLVTKAFVDVQKYSWKKRASRIMKLIT